MLKIKIFTIAIIVILVFSFSSCAVTLDKEMELGSDVENIISVDIYRVDKIDGSVLDIRDRYSPVHSIVGEAISVFVNELMELEYKRDVIFPFHVDYAHEFSTGYIIFIEYNNGGCDVYAEKGIYTHRISLEGKISYNYSPDEYRGEKPWCEIIEKYLSEN